MDGFFESVSTTFQPVQAKLEEADVYYYSPVQTRYNDSSGYRAFLNFDIHIGGQVPTEGALMAATHEGAIEVRAIAPLGPDLWHALEHPEFEGYLTFDSAHFGKYAFVRVIASYEELYHRYHNPEDFHLYVRMDSDASGSILHQTAERTFTGTDKEVMVSMLLFIKIFDNQESSHRLAARLVYTDTTNPPKNSKEPTLRQYGVTLFYEFSAHFFVMEVQPEAMVAAISNSSISTASSFDELL